MNIDKCLEGIIKVQFSEIEEKYVCFRRVHKQKNQYLNTKKKFHSIFYSADLFGDV